MLPHKCSRVSFSPLFIGLVNFFGVVCPLKAELIWSRVEWSEAEWNGGVTELSGDLWSQLGRGLELCGKLQVFSIYNRFKIFCRWFYNLVIRSFRFVSVWFSFGAVWKFHFVLNVGKAQQSKKKQTKLGHWRFTGFLCWVVGCDGAKTLLGINGKI